MKIYHIIKKSGCDTDFRRVMLTALERIQILKKSKKDLSDIKIYLASGFFNINVSSPKVDILNYVDPITKLTLSNLLLGLDVEIFGAYNGSKDLLSLKAILSPKVKTLTVYYKHRFHTKLFVISINNTPVFEIIGSSNMTLPAYEGLQYSARGKHIYSLNTETDLILYNDEFNVAGTNHVLGENMKLQSNMMQFDYRAEDNNDIMFVERMNSIVDYLNELKSQMKKV